MLSTVQNNIHERALEISKKFQENESELIEILYEACCEKVYLAMGCSSLFIYARDFLKLSENNSYTYCAIAKKSRAVPELKEEIRNGNLAVSKAARIVSVLTPETKSEWIPKAIELPKAQLEREIVRVHPELERRETIRKVSEDRVSLRLNLSDRTLQKLKR